MAKEMNDTAVSRQMRKKRTARGNAFGMDTAMASSAQKRVGTAQISERQQQLEKNAKNAKFADFFPR